MDTISNNEMSEFTTHQQHFRNNNGTVYTKSINHEQLYVVYSYGEHWPMYVHDNVSHTWFGNGDRYSRPTTNRHTVMATPDIHPEDMVYVSKDILQDIISFGGYTEYCADRVIRQPTN